MKNLHIAVVLCIFVQDITSSVVPMQGSSVAPQSITKSTDQMPRLPGSWNDVCTNKLQFISTEFLTSLPKEAIDNIEQVSCTLSQTNDSLVFTELREWMQNLDRKVAVQVLCPTDGVMSGEVNLPWPMKAANLVWLHVDGCRVRDYHAEYFSSEITQIPDELRYLDLRNLQILFDPFQLPHLIENTSFSPPDSECGPVTVEKLTMSNIMYQMDISQESKLEAFLNVTDNWDLDNLFKTLLLNFNNFNFTCNFTNLRFVDDSYSLSSSSEHAYLLTSKSLYPEVRVYNMSHSGLKIVPEEFENWSEHFPQLTTFDLSYNHISEFWIRDLSPNWHSDGIYINLQYNNITSLTTSFLERVLNLSKVNIDLRNNPVLTDCVFYANFAEELDNGTLSSEIAKSNLSYILQTPCWMLEPQANTMSTSETSHDWLYALIPLGIICGIAAILLTIFIRSRKVGSESVSDKLT